MTDEEIAQLQKENDYLRAIVARKECAYGHRLPNGICKLGYPGCACADDIMCAEEPFLKDLLERLRKAEAKLEGA